MRPFLVLIMLTLIAVASAPPASSMNPSTPGISNPITKNAQSAPDKRWRNRKQCVSDCEIDSGSAGNIGGQCTAHCQSTSNAQTQEEEESCPPPS
jgi:hypothetical protein